MTRSNLAPQKRESVTRTSFARQDEDLIPLLSGVLRLTEPRSVDVCWRLATRIGLSL